MSLLADKSTAVGNNYQSLQSVLKKLLVLSFQLLVQPISVKKKLFYMKAVFSPQQSCLAPEHSENCVNLKVK